MQPEKITITTETGGTIVALFNPERYSVNKSVQFAEIGIPGLDSPVLQFVRGQNEKITMDLFFDTTDKGMADSVTDVRDESGAVYRLLKIDPDTHAPLRVKLTWGDDTSLFSYGSSVSPWCVLESVNEEFSVFAPSGIPLRAKLTCTFREAWTIEQQLQDSGRHSSDRTKVRRVRRGETLAYIAWQEYNDPGQWRPIADANHIENPRVLTPGMLLTIPANPAGGPLMGSATLLPVNIYEGQDFYVPAYRVLINAKKPNVESDVISVSYTDSLTNVDSFELVVNNWDPEGTNASSGTVGGFKYSDTDTFNPWQQVELWMGYYRNGQDELKRMLTGEISTMSPNFPAGSGSTLTVRALNLLHRFRTKQESKAFFQKKDTEIAQELVQDIASELRSKIPNLTLQMDPEEVKQNLAGEDKVPYLEMHNQYPIVFLMQRARDIGYELFIEEQESGQQRTVIVHFRETNDVLRNTYAIEWGKSLISFQPTLQTANQVSELTVLGWNPQTKAKVEVKVTRADLVKEGVVDPTALNITESELSQKSEYVVDHPVQSAEEARTIALRRMRQIAQGLVEARGKTIGIPDLRSGCKLSIAGLGTRFTGTYLVTATTHTIGDGGYTTDFTARMEVSS